jgi:hypothetical protein
MSVRLSAWKILALTGWILMEFDWRFSNIWGEISSLIKSDLDNGYFTWRPLFYFTQLDAPTARTHLKKWSARRRTAESTWYVRVIRNVYLQWMNSLYTLSLSVLQYGANRADILAVVTWPTLVTICCYLQHCLVVTARAVFRLQQIFITRCVYEFSRKAGGPAIQGFKKQFLRIKVFFFHFTDKHRTDNLVRLIDFIKVIIAAIFCLVPVIYC